MQDTVDGDGDGKTVPTPDAAPTQDQIDIVAHAQKKALTTKRLDFEKRYINSRKEAMPEMDQIKLNKDAILKFDATVPHDSTGTTNALGVRYSEALVNQELPSEYNLMCADIYFPEAHPHTVVAQFMFSNDATKNLKKLSDERWIETKIVKWAPAGHQKPNKWAPVDNENTKGKLMPMPLSSFSHRIAIMRDDSYYELGHISEAMKEELMEPEFKQFCREKDEQLLKVVNAEFRNLVAFQFARQNFNKFKISGTHDMREHSNNDINSNLLEACDWTGWEITTNEEYPHKTRRGVSKETLEIIIKGVARKKVVAEKIALLATGLKLQVTPSVTTLPLFSNGKRKKEAVEESMTAPDPDHKKGGPGRKAGKLQKRSVPAASRSTRNTASNARKATVDLTKGQPNSAESNSIDPQLAAQLNNLNASINAQKFQSPPPFQDTNSQAGGAPNLSSPPPSSQGSSHFTSVSRDSFCQMSDTITTMGDTMKDVKDDILFLRKNASCHEAMLGLQHKVEVLTMEKGALAKELTALESTNKATQDERDNWKDMCNNMLATIADMGKPESSNKKKKG